MFSPGDRVRVTIPTQLDFDRKYDGATGHVIDVTEDDLGDLTGDDRDDFIFEVELDEFDSCPNFRHLDLERVNND